MSSSSNEKKSSSGCTSMINVLPENLFFEILSWLPAKKSTQLKTVNKSFFDIISCPYFHTMQATHHVKTDTGLIIISFSNISSFEALFLTDDSGIPKDDYSLSFLKEWNMIRILASSHGLIFFQTSNNNNLHMFNPVTKKHAEIVSPPPEAPTNVCMHYVNGDDFDAPKDLFMYSVDGEDYEMIYVTRISRCGPLSCKLMLKCRRYSSKDMSWEDISEIDAGCRIIGEEAVLVSGSIYWISEAEIYSVDFDPCLIEFNIEQRSSRVVVLPKQVVELISSYDDDIRVASWADGSLCLIQYIVKKRTMVIWVMSSSSGSSSEIEWKKVDEIGIVDLGLQGDGDQVLVDNYTLINGELLVICVREWIYGYNLSEGSMKMLGRHKQGRRPSLMPYANTFRSCAKFEQPIESSWV